MDDFFKNCDSFLLEAASITSKDGSRVCPVDTIPHSSTKRPEDFRVTETDVIERPCQSEVMSIYYSKRVPFDHTNNPILGLPKSAKTEIKKRYLGRFPKELRNPEVHTGILLSNRPLYKTAYTLCTAEPMSSDCIMLTYESVTKRIVTKDAWGKIIHDRNITYVIFPIHLIPRVSENDSDICFSKAEFNHDLASELNEIFQNAIKMENYLYLKTIEEQNEATRRKIEDMITRDRITLPNNLKQSGKPRKK